MTYSPRRITDQQSNFVMRLSPELHRNDSFPLFDTIETCVKGGAGYRGCGTDAARTTWFRQNAETNIRGLRSALGELCHAPKMRGLDKVDAYHTSLQQFYLEAQERRLAFALQRDPSILEGTLGLVNPANDCKGPLDMVRKAATSQQANRAAEYDWYSCINEKMQHRLGPFQQASGIVSEACRPEGEIPARRR